jgi:hypothetical protein
VLSAGMLAVKRWCLNGSDAGVTTRLLTSDSARRSLWRSGNGARWFRGVCSRQLCSVRGGGGGTSFEGGASGLEKTALDE